MMDQMMLTFTSRHYWNEHKILVADFIGIQEKYPYAANIASDVLTQPPFSDCVALMTNSFRCRVLPSGWGAKLERIESEYVSDISHMKRLKHVNIINNRYVSKLPHGEYDVFLCDRESQSLMNQLNRVRVLLAPNDVDITHISGIESLFLTGPDTNYFTPHLRELVAPFGAIRVPIEAKKSLTVFYGDEYANIIELFTELREITFIGNKTQSVCGRPWSQLLYLAAPDILDYEELAESGVVLRDYLSDRSIGRLHCCKSFYNLLHWG